MTKLLLIITPIPVTTTINTSQFILFITIIVVFSCLVYLIRKAISLLSRFIIINRTKNSEIICNDFNTLNNQYYLSSKTNIMSFIRNKYMWKLSLIPLLIILITIDFFDLISGPIPNYYFFS